MSLQHFAINGNIDSLRLYNEDIPNENFLETDYIRLTNSNAFQRLQYKTQVFTNNKGDHYRNRLTHSLSVAAIAKNVAQSLSVSTNLAESISLVHDLGHSPFGHAGERALQNLMIDNGGFCHNTYCLKLLTLLETRSNNYSGLNLSWYMLEGIVKHNGPILDNIPDYIAQYNSKHDLALNLYPTIEAQIAAQADDIAYICHDLVDGIRSNFVNLEDFFTIKSLPNIIKNYDKSINKSLNVISISETLSNFFINDLIITSKNNINTNKIKTLFDVQNAGKWLVGLSEEAQKSLDNIKDFLFKKLYHHPQISKTNKLCQKIIKMLFECYIEDPSKIPSKWLNKATDNIYITVADYIAGMTDRYAESQLYKNYHIKTFHDLVDD